MKKHFLFLLFGLLLPINYILAITCPVGQVPSADGLSCVAVPAGLSGVLISIHQLLNGVIPILISLGVVYFVWGVVNYVIADDEEAKTKGKDRIIFGIIGLAVITSLWGLVAILMTTFGLTSLTNVAPSLSSVTATGGSCTLAGSPKFQDILCYFTGIINNSIIPLLFAVATAFFVWGAIKFFIIEVDEEAKREQGKQFMLWGIIALAVMISVWGLVGVLADTFGFSHSILPKVTPS